MLLEQAELAEPPQRLAVYLLFLGLDLRLSHLLVVDTAARTLGQPVVAVVVLVVAEPQVALQTQAAQEIPLP